MTRNCSLYELITDPFYSAKSEQNRSCHQTNHPMALHDPIYVLLYVSGCAMQSIRIIKLLVIRAQTDPFYSAKSEQNRSCHQTNHPMALHDPIYVYVVVGYAQCNRPGSGSKIGPKWAFINPIPKPVS